VKNNQFDTELISNSISTTQQVSSRGAKKICRRAWGSREHPDAKDLHLRDWLVLTDGKLTYVQKLHQENGKKASQIHRCAEISGINKECRTEKQKLS
jgi:hypothetical protein